MDGFIYKLIEAAQNLYLNPKGPLCGSSYAEITAKYYLRTDNNFLNVVENGFIDPDYGELIQPLSALRQKKREDEIKFYDEMRESIAANMMKRKHSSFNNTIEGDF